jgi:hypothetical protein
MVVLRILGVAFLAVCAFAGAFLLAYAAILGGWIVYADYSGALGSTNGSEVAIAALWAPVGALVAALLAAGSVIRMRVGSQPQPAVASRATIPVAQVEGPDLELERRLGEHAALLKQLQAISMGGSEGPQTPRAISRKQPAPVDQDQRRVA